MSVRRLGRLVAALVIAFATTPLMAAESESAKLEVEVIAAASGMKPTVAPDGVVRVNWSRTDVAVSVGGARLPAAAGLGSWAAFVPTSRGAMVMGDTVVFEDEVDAAMDAAFSNGLSVTGLHNHFFYEEPRVFFMHVGGEGDPKSLAVGIKAVWDAIKVVRKAHPAPGKGEGMAIVESKLDVARLESIVGQKATVTDGVPKITIGVNGAMHGTKVGASAGLTTWAAFFGSDEKAAMDGDVIMRAEEVQSTLHALRKAGLHVVALHNHMIDEAPTFYFTHFWGTGKASALAAGFRQTLDATRTGPGQ